LRRYLFSLKVVIQEAIFLTHGLRAGMQEGTAGAFLSSRIHRASYGGQWHLLIMRDGVESITAQEMTVDVLPQLLSM